MKHLQTYIFEKIKNLPKTIKGIIVFDIDDTLLKSNPETIGVYKKEPGKSEKRLTTEEFAKDPDASDPSKKSWFDYREFRDPVKVYNSIISGTPLIKNLRIMDDYIEAGYEFCFLTARSCEETIKKALDDFLKVKKPNGALEELGDIFNKTMSHAINDESKTYEGVSDAEKKANILKKLCKEYDRVVFVDDDHKNVSAARGLNIDNLKVIKAWDE
jgi:hypothetical protein